MAVRKPIVILDTQHLSELQAGDGLMPFMNPGTTTLSQLIQAMLDAGIIAAEVLGPPVNISAPVVTGASFVGDTATTSNGSWSGGPIIEYEYLWQQNDGSWEDVIGETNNTFVDMLLGEYRSAVRARNSVDWSEWAYSTAFVINEPSEGFATWSTEQNYNAVLTDGNSTLTWGEEAFANGYAISNVPLNGKQRWQIRCRVDYSADPMPADYYTAAGVWGRAVEDYMGGANIFHSGFGPDQQAAGVSAHAGYLPFVTDGEWDSSITPDESLIPDWYFEFFTDTSFSGGTYTCRIWARQVWGASGASSFFAGGDPATDTTPCAVLTLDHPFYAGASTAQSPGSTITLLNPDDYLASPAVGGGFATGIST